MIKCNMPAPVKMALKSCPCAQTEAILKEFQRIKAEAEEFNATWEKFISDLWYEKSETHVSYAFRVELDYPGCVIAVFCATNWLQKLKIPIYAVYVGRKSNVIVIEIEKSERTAKSLNKKIKGKLARFQTAGWLIVGHEHKEDGSEEEQSVEG